MTVSYFITDDTGLIIKSGYCQEETLDMNTEGHANVHIGVAPHGRYRYVNGEFISAELPPDYRQLRQLEYPPMQDLADALYWQAQGDNSKMTQYLAKCAGVKAQYPKPV